MNFFEEVYYINLDERVDRRCLFETQAAELEIPVTRFSGIHLTECDMPSRWKCYYDEAHDKNTDNWHRSKKQTMAEIGCAYSHIRVIKIAKQRRLKNVLIFEDDCLFLNTWKQNIQSIVNEIKSLENNWDIIYFGGELPGPIQTGPVLNNKLILSRGGIYCLHAYCVNERFFDTILAYDPEFCRQIDVMMVNTLSQNYLPIDIMVVQRSELLSSITGELSSTNNEKEQIDRWKTNIIVGDL
jgi:hypothetical protein